MRKIIKKLFLGLYPEYNGIVSDVMYDPTHQSTFYQENNAEFSKPYWWNVSTPIWATSVANNISTGLYGWPICGVKISDQIPDYCTKHDRNQEMAMAEKHLNDILVRFQNNELQFALLYIEYSDTIGHAAGPDSSDIINTLNTIDQLFVDLIRRIDDNNLTDINIIVTSDHGMAELNASNHLQIEDYITIDDITMINDYGTCSGIYPKAARLEKVYNDLKKMEKKGGVTVYKKSDIPAKYHIKQSDRTAPIVITANPGFYILPLLNNEKQNPPFIDSEIYHNIGKGVHGYDPALVTEMNGVFLLYGSAFNKNYNSNEIQMVDVYNLMTCVLDIRGHRNNGSWETVCPFLKDNCHGFCSQWRNSATSLSLNTLILSCILFTAIWQSI
ncbi:Ectonucleotide pyrophosphatase/phosphodiesterase member 6, variant 2 [Chamberlinius hualienensis]